MSGEEQGSGTTTGCGLPSIEQMLAANLGKTPISRLQEYGTRVGKTPVYDLLKAEGQAHQPNFTFRVTVGDTSCTGQGPSKKAAKHRAAEVALKHLRGGSMLEPALEDSSSFSPLDSSLPEDGPVLPTVLMATAGSSVVLSRSPPMEVPPPVSPQQSECNPVGALQELVVQKGWRLPEYTVTQESGPAHRKEFTMTCQVERFVEIGSGTSKKLAKRNAAAKMLQRVHMVPLDAREGSEAEPDEDHFSIGSRQDGLRNRGPGCTWDSLRNSAGEKILSLRSCPPGALGALGPACCGVLSELSEEQAFHVSYVDIARSTFSSVRGPGAAPARGQQQQQQQRERPPRVHAAAAALKPGRLLYLRPWARSLLAPPGGRPRGRLEQAPETHDSARSPLRCPPGAPGGLPAHSPHPAAWSVRLY